MIFCLTHFLSAQYLGMMFHRWGTISQIISTTEMPMCRPKTADRSEEPSSFDKQAVRLVQEFMKGDRREEKEK